ncbi:MAG: acyl-CoA dehydrogenase family protein [Proteobacteria bacterium]|nr:acyl-CoA dehydrogenase family protein [Pseudomonadota bacterium]
MIEWSEEQRIALDAIRKFVNEEVVPHADALDQGDMLPYDIIRKMYRTFGIDEFRRDRFERSIERTEALERGDEIEASHEDDDIGIDQLLSIELCKHSAGIVTAMGVTQLAAGTIASKGTLEQKRRWGLDLLTGDKIGSWAITEPGSGSDAFGGMASTAKLNADGNYVLNGSKTFITNGPYADTIVFICKLVEEGVDPRKRKIVTFILDKEMPGLERSDRLRKMGLHSSPTGQLFLDNVVAGPERLLGGLDKKSGKQNKRSDPRSTFAAERVGVVSMSLGVVEQCLERCVSYAKERIQWEKPIGDYQLIQLKLAEMEVARFNIQNMLFNYLERRQKNLPMSFAEASAMKLYSTKAAVEVASEAIQLFGGNGYMAEYKVEQLYRDARVMRIYAGTDEMQVRAIARDLLTR